MRFISDLELDHYALHFAYTIVFQYSDNSVRSPHSPLNKSSTSKTHRTTGIYNNCIVRVTRPFLKADDVLKKGNV